MTEIDGAALIKENLSISELIGRYVQLKRKGHRLTACCPFHNEKSPSFHVDETKGFYHCFGCGQGGDLIKFAMEIEGLSFPEALDFLADIAGVELPKRGRSGPARELVDGLRQINAEAVQFYHNLLNKNPAAKKYLLDRGIRESTIQLFKLGFAPNQWDGLYNHIRNKFSPALMEKSGLFKLGKTGKPYDIFRDRVMFPIYDTYNHVVAFGGRLISGEDGPKYINSPETPLYTKGRHLYNLQFARAFLKKTREVVVVEGYMDAIQVYQAGVGGVIASLGTAFTPEQGKLLKRYTPKVILNFDGDKAGFKAARTSIETFLKLDMEIGVVSLPDNQDPDDFIKNQGVEAYKAQIGEATGFYEFLMEYLAEDRDLIEDPRHRSHVAQELCTSLHCITDPVVQSYYLEKLGEDLNIPKHVVEQLFSQKAPAPARKPTKKAPRQQAPPQQSQPEPHPEDAYLDAISSNSSHPDEFPDEAFSEGPFSDDHYTDDSAVPEFFHEEIFDKAPPPRMNTLAFSKIEQEFLYHVMHHQDFASRFREEHREQIHSILQHIFHDRAWILDFIYFDDHHSDFESRLKTVPENFRAMLRHINFEDAFEHDDDERMNILFPELVRQMLLKLVDINKQRLRTLPHHEHERIRKLRKQNHECMKQYHMLYD